MRHATVFVRHATGFMRHATSPSSLRHAIRRELYRRLRFEQLDDRWLLSANPLDQAPSTADETAVANSINAFAQNLYAQLQQQQGANNLIFSPFSIETALAMTYAGAEGETASQMASTLGFTLDPADVESGFGALLNALNAEGQSGSFTLNAADALWLQQGFQLESQFVNLMQSDFGGGLNQVDFENAAEAATDTINNWVASQTNDKIQNLIAPGELNDLTRLVLTNAVYFNGQWTSGFDPSQTNDAPFTLSDGSQDSVSTMHQTGTFGYMESDGYQVLDMPYQGNQLSMDILLPTSDVTTNTLPANLGDWLQGLSQQYVDVSLPKFQINTAFSLNNTLQAMGMTDAFSKSADFTGIHIPTNPNDNLYITNVDHQAYIDVDESGTEAAAATAVSMSVACCVAATPIPIEFNADHPFEFVIRDDQSGAILFQGQVMNPDPSATQTPPAPGSASPTLPGPIQFANPGGSSTGGTNPVAPPAGTAPVAAPPVQLPVMTWSPPPAPVIPLGPGAELDPNFGTGGIVDTPSPPAPVAPPSSSGLESSIDLSAIVVSGTIVPSGSYVNHLNVVASLVQPDGKIVIAGVMPGNGTSESLVERFNADGSVDTSFGVNGVVTAPLASANFILDDMALAPDGDIVLGGSVKTFTGELGAIAALTTSGTLDTSFGSRGFLVPPAPVTSSSPADWNLTDIDNVVITKDGKIIYTAVTSATTASSAPPNSFLYPAPDEVLGEADEDGVPDPNFSGSDLSTAFRDNGYPATYALGLEPTGQIVVLTNGQLAEFNADGTPDDSFGTGGMVTIAANNSNSSTMVIQPDGKILVSTLPAYSMQFDVVRLNSDGSLDSSFNLATPIYVFPGTPEELTMALNSSGQLVMSGGSLDGLARFNSDGSFDSNFPLGMVQLADVVVQSNDEVLVVGYPAVPDGANFAVMIDPTGDWTMQKVYWPTTAAPAAPTGVPPVGIPPSQSPTTPPDPGPSPTTPASSFDLALLSGISTNSNATPAQSPTPAVVGAGGVTFAGSSGSQSGTSQPTKTASPVTLTALLESSEADDEAPTNSSATLTPVDDLFAVLGT